MFVEKFRTREPSSPPFSREWGDTLTLPGRQFVDGLAIGYFPRSLIRSRGKFDVTTVLNGKVGTTTFDLDGRHTTEDIDAMDDPVKVVEVRGSTNAVGIFGMTGEFTGWFSDDEAGVPIKG